MFSLALALAVGWWITPSSTPSFSLEQDTHASRPAVVQPPVTGREQQASHGGADIRARESENNPAKQGYAAPPASASTSPAAEAIVETDAASMTYQPSAPTITEETAGKPASTRDEEVQRLKAQADSETQSERQGRSSAKPSTSSGGGNQPRSRERGTQAKTLDLSRALAECNKEEGLFFRERCKWRLCNGRWGKQGCPSYENDRSAAWRVNLFWRALFV